MTSFRHLKSSIRLQDLARSPIDLTQTENFTEERIRKMCNSALSFKLLYAAERVTNDVLAALFDLAKETQAVEKNKKMQAGEIVNFIHGTESENRAALHTAMRDFFDAPQQSEKAKDAAKLAHIELDKLKKFMDDIDRKGHFTDLVQIGIGGSELGPKAVYLALEAFHKKGRKVHFLSNVDPDDAAAIFKDLDWSKTLFVSVSKSGSTLETRTNEEFVREQLKKHGLESKHHLLAVTGKGSPMDDPSQYLASFYIWDYVGGRYSATSMVGAVALAFSIGMDSVMEFLRGAHEMDKVALLSDPHKNLPLLSALLGIWNRNFLNHPTVAVIPYSQALSRFPAHLQQLDMESNGKHIDKEGVPVDYVTGPILWGEMGTNGQHSFYQSIHQGTTVVPLEFIGFEQSQRKLDLVYKGTTSQEKLLSNLFAQSIALATGQRSDNPNKVFTGNRPNRILLTHRLDPHTMGALLSFYEHKVDFQGFIWNINSFDQEGVELGKKLALKIIDEFADIRHKGEIGPGRFPLGKAYIEHLENLPK